MGRRLFDSKGEPLYQGSEHNRHPHWVYFILAPEVNRIKIGLSSSVLDRLRNMQVGSPVILKCIGVIEYPSEYEARKREKNYHNKFYSQHFNGEWFNCTDGLTQEIEADIASVKHNREENERLLKGLNL
jgi:hypothetical protein